MLTDLDERVPALDLGRLGSGAASGLAQATLAALGSGRCRCELEADHVDLSSVPGITWLARPARAWFPWVAVGAARPLDRAFLEGLARELGTGTRGLVITRAPAPDSESFELVGPSSAAELEDPVLLAQLAHALLVTCPPTRVLLGSPADAELLAGALVGHRVAQAGAHLTEGPGPALREVQDLLRACRGAARRGRPVAVPVPVERHGDWDARARTVARGRARGAVLRAGPAAAAGFLDPEGRGGFQPPAEPSAPRPVEEQPLRPGTRATGARRVLYACPHLLGDTLAATATLAAHRARHPGDEITFLVADEAYAPLFTLCAHVDRLARVAPPSRHDLVYSSSRAWLAGHPYLERFDEVVFLDVQEVAARCHGDAMGIAEGFARLAGLDLDGARPSLDRLAASATRPPEAPTRPYLVLSRNTVSGRIGPNDPRTKRWSDRRWRAVARHARAHHGLDVVSVGTAREPRLHDPSVLELHDLGILELAGLVAGAQALVTVDNGVFHLGQALGTPLVHLQPRWLGERWTASAPGTPHRDLRATLPRLSAPRVIQALDELLEQSAG